MSTESAGTAQTGGAGTARKIAVGAGAIAFMALAVYAATSGFFDWANAAVVESMESGSYGVALGLVYLLGLATSLTPCVYPMIAITVSVFGARQAKTKLEGASLSTAFVLGLAATLTPLGLVAGWTGDVFGAWLANPVVVIGFAIFFVAMALAMFGAYELNLPPTLQNRLAMAGGVGLKGAFVLGMVNSLIAAPCTGPGIGSILAFIGNTRDVGFGAAAMFIYALGLGTLTWLVGTFSISLPKSGAWMDRVKSIFGVVMLVMALYYLRTLFPDLMAMFEHESTLLVGSIVVTVAGVLLGAIHLSFHDEASKKLRKGVGVALTTSGSFLFVAWMISPPPGARLTWRDDFQAAIDEARSEGTPYIVDFGASWCGACGELERNTFTDPRVVREGGRFVTVHVDLSPGQDSPEKRALLASYAQRGLPLVVLHDGQGNEVHRVTQFVPADELLELMRDVR